MAMPLTIADIGTQLLMDSTVNRQEIEDRITARFFAAVHKPERGHGCSPRCWCRRAPPLRPAVRCEALMPR